MHDSKLSDFPFEEAYPQRFDTMLINPELKIAIIELERIARKTGLNFFPTIFEVLNEKALSEFGAYGLPVRFGHWSFGTTFQILEAQQRHGFSKIMEMVINNDPSYAFLLDRNSHVINCMVIAHVYAHVDFFKNNFMFKYTNRHIIDTAGFHARQIRKFEQKYGVKTIETILDAALSLQHQIDPKIIFTEGNLFKRGIKDEISSDDPKSWLRELNQHIVSYRDLLGQIIAYSNLPSYQKQILSFIRAEGQYFLPQAATKIMNEGWATYWHLKLMHEFLEDGDIIELAKYHASVIANVPGQLNPYRMGFKIYQDIEKRWDNDYGEGEGIKKIFEVRALDNDISFIRNYLTKDMIKSLNLFEYAKKGQKWVVTSIKAKQIRQTMIRDLANFGKPMITVADRDWNNNRELVLRHEFEGVPLKLEYAKDVIKQTFNLWQRKIHLWTVKSDGQKIAHLLYDGNEIKEFFYKFNDEKIPNGFDPVKRHLTNNS